MKRKRLVQGTLMAVALALFAAHLLLFAHDMATGSPTPQPKQGLIFPLSNHGDIVYVASQEKWILAALIWSGVAAFLSAATIEVYWRK